MTNIPKIKQYNDGNFFLFAGPCIIENEKTSLEIAEKILTITEKLKIPFVFKGSFKKANRSRIDSFTGIGDKKALEILKKVGDTFNIPTVTDIHETGDVDLASEYVDVLQIPAFLARQTDLLVKAGKSGKHINIKKGQFMAPESMEFAVNKVLDSGNKNVIITDRGTMFGYKDLIVDFTGIPTMKKYAPVVMDITHSLQQPNTSSGITGGRPRDDRNNRKRSNISGSRWIIFRNSPQPCSSKI